MAEFAKLISDLPLYQELDRAAARDGIDPTDVARLKGLVNDVADTAGPAMALIPKIFQQYTVHDIHHCRNVIARMGDIIPDETREKLNALEIAFLLLSALLHDIGMVVTDQEKNETLLSDAFQRFRAEGHADRNKAIEEARQSGNEPRARAIEDALLAEYYRRLHPERVRKFMDRHLAGRFQYRDVDFADDLARLCESHSWGVQEGSHPEKAVAKLHTDDLFHDVQVNSQYLACILRLADILDFDRSRTPLAVFQHIDFTEPKSWEEWNKHLQVKGRQIRLTQVVFDIPCEHPVFYVAVNQFLDWIDKEIQDCRQLTENKPQAIAERYKLLLPHVVDRHKVRMADPSYVAGAFRFQLEYENILTLLMDKSLYPDPSLFLRELLQNALDACRRKEADMQVKGIAYTPKIVVWDKTDDPDDPRVVFQDNGVGMSQRIVEQYFLRVGRSYYRSPEFDAERQRLREHGKELDACSQFGIGILSCFLVGDRFEVETHQEGYEPLHITIEGPSKYFVVRRLPRPEASVLFQKPASDAEDGPPRRTGTRVTVHFRAGVGVDVWGTLDTFAVNVDYTIFIHSPIRLRERRIIVIPALQWEETPSVWNYRFSRDVSGSALAEVLIPSVIPFSSWDFSRHLRGCSWFWLLRDSDGQAVPKRGFLEVGSTLRLTGTPSFVAFLDREYRNIPRERRCPYQEWFEKLKKSAKPDRHYWLAAQWAHLSAEEKILLDEAVSRRSLVVGSSEMRAWTRLADTVEALLKGSLEWADQPVHFEPYEIGSESEDLLAVHSILLPAGIVEWSPIEAESERIELHPLFGGFRVDARGPKAPRPAAHRLFIPAGEAYDFRQEYLYAALLHGVDLVTRHGRTQEWRTWLSELIGGALDKGLNLPTFVKLFGQLVEDSCGISIEIDNDNLHHEPIYLEPEDGQTSGLRLLCSFDPRRAKRM